MKRILALAFLLSSAVPCLGSEPDTAHVDPADEVAASTLIAVGQPAPVFTAELLGEGIFDLAAHRGEVVLINWFATWCGPCKAEMPHLQAEVWERFEKEGLVMVSVAREEKADVVAPFVKQYQATWPFALDPERQAFAKYATAFIPRNVVVDRTGTIVFQSQGFERQEFDEMTAVIARELDVPNARTVAPLAEHYAAMGPAEARYAITSITANAVCTSPRGPYTTQLMMAPWGRLFFRQESEGDDPFEVVLDGDRGWANGEPIDAMTRRIARGHAFQWQALEFEDWFTDLTPAGDDEFAGVSCTRWTGRDAHGSDNQVYFEKATGLMKGLDLPNDLLGGRVLVVFEEYRTVDGVQLPARVRATDSQGDFVLDFTEITTNDVDPAVFTVVAE